jgi:hypothetical protein
MSVPLKSRCGFNNIRIKSESKEKSSSEMFVAYVKIVRAAELVRVHAKIASDGAPRYL